MAISRNICVVGLGYVGLPVLVAFAKHGQVVGLDINQKRIAQLKKGIDETHEVENLDLINSNISFTNELKDASQSNFYIITVPTPVDQNHCPDFSYLESASSMIGKILKKGDIVVYESTVYPGATEEICLPILESTSGLKIITDFGLGYSPERINPGDKEHTFTKIKKIISASDPQTLAVVDQMYGQVVEAGLHHASSIKVAEASKIIENVQRDVNISLMNELAIICNKLEIDTKSVLDAAKTKWNFLPFSPGLVGGHCIGVDPYYLTYKAKEIGLDPQVILAGRRVNDSMGKYIADKTMEKIEKIESTASPKQKNTKKRVTILGLTFKENCPDVRNTRVIDIVRELEKQQVEVQIHDQWANHEDVFLEYNLRLSPMEELRPAHALIFAVPHNIYLKMTLEDYQRICLPQGAIIDIKSICPQNLLIKAGFMVWRL